MLSFESSKIIQIKYRYEILDNRSLNHHQHRIKCSIFGQILDTIQG